jgi:alkylation response protein AidB-like acyl-CoA dehydrogenase
VTGARFEFEPASLPQHSAALRREVRAFLKDALKGWDTRLGAASWSGHDPEFSRKLGERGWIAMTWPKQYGGHERSALERYVVLEELLAAGAPVGAHWVADRQSGPLLLRCGTEEQRRTILPRIARGECYFCIGMSEPNSGSDLASVQTRARKVEGGWRVNGTKLWSSNAHRVHYMILFCRTADRTEDRHAGLSQLLIDLSRPGVRIRPIKSLAGDAHFNEVVFEDFFVPDDMLIGKEGQGWAQVTSELAFERSGPERLLSSYRLIAELTRAIGAEPDDRAAQALGRLVAHLATLRRLSISVATILDRGGNPNVEAALVKDLGTSFEQDVPEVARLVLERESGPGSEDMYEAIFAYAAMHAPSFSLRGGTREVLRGIIARGLGLR